MIKENGIQFTAPNKENSVKSEGIWDRIQAACENKNQQLNKASDVDFNLDKNKKTAVDLINESTFEEIIAFLREIQNVPNKHLLPQWFIEKVTEKFFQGWEKLPKDFRQGMDGEDVMINLITATHHYGKFKYAKSDDQSITDKFYISFVHLLEKYPTAGQDYWKDLSHGADSIRPDILINGLSDIINNENVSLLAKGNVMHNFGMVYAQNSRRKTFDAGIDKALDYENHDNYLNTVKVIKFLKKFHASSEYLPDRLKEYETHFAVDGKSESDEVSAGIKKILLEKLKQKKRKLFARSVY